MTVLVIGSGAREHALALRLGAEGNRVLCAPGNAGTAEIAENLSLNPDDGGAVVRSCRERGADLVVIGPEDPLAAGLADLLRREGYPVFGPGAVPARLESSKDFARAFAERHGIPRARTEVLRTERELRDYIDRTEGKRVLKKSGLAAGKGVLESSDPAELLAFGTAVLGGDVLLAEEFLTGRELSVFAVCDGTRYTVLPPCGDHKKPLPGNLGPNTGGMGALCPVPFADSGLLRRIENEVILPTFRGLEEEGLLYRGILFFGIMAASNGPKLLEYNVRFGDPETQSLLAVLRGDFGTLLGSAASGRLDPGTADAAASPPEAWACGFVAAAPGYPGPYPKGIPVEFLPEDVPGRNLLFHASTLRDPGGRLVTGGGRCFTAVGLGRNLAEAREHGLTAVRRIRFEGVWFREDIGAMPA
ncbi:MAG: phosphoribosylamine--glycine ligase [Treponema sp.]|nr:phosphoribosylamine--glycine ligase [Treponema sp.]